MVPALRIHRLIVNVGWLRPILQTVLIDISYALCDKGILLDGVCMNVILIYVYYTYSQKIAQNKNKISKSLVILHFISM